MIADVYSEIFANESELAVADYVACAEPKTCRSHRGLARMRKEKTSGVG